MNCIQLTRPNKRHWSMYSLCWCGHRADMLCLCFSVCLLILFCRLKVEFFGWVSLEPARRINKEVDRFLLMTKKRTARPHVEVNRRSGCTFLPAWRRIYGGIRTGVREFHPRLFFFLLFPCHLSFPLFFSLSFLVPTSSKYRPTAEVDQLSGPTGFPPRLLLKINCSSRGEHGFSPTPPFCRPFNYLYNPPYGHPPPIHYIGWVGVGWQRHWKTRRSVRDLDNQGAVFDLLAVSHSWRSSYAGWITFTPHEDSGRIT